MSTDGEEADMVEQPAAPRFNHDEKLEKKLTQSLVDAGEETDCEVLLNVINWEQFEDITGWDNASPQVRYNLPPRRRRPQGTTQDDSSSVSSQANSKKRCYELDFVNSPAWKICVEPTSYRYVSNNGRYRASKLVRKLEIQKSVRKTCNEKLSPEQRQLQKEIQRELRKEFETYLHMEKQKQIALNLEKQKRRERAAEAHESSECESNSQENQSEAESYDRDDASTPVDSMYSSHSTLEEQPSSSSKTEAGSRQIYRNAVQKDLELPPINAPSMMTTMSEPPVKRNPGTADPRATSNGKVFHKSKLAIESQPGDSDSDGGYVPKTMRSMSEPPPPQFNGKIENSLQSDHRETRDALCQSEPQTHRNEGEVRDSPGKISYSQSLCDLGKQPAHSIPSKFDSSLPRDMIKVKHISTSHAAKARHDPENNHWDLQSSRLHDSNQTAQYGSYPNTSANHPSINSAPAYQSRAKNSAANPPGQQGSLEMTLLTSKFSSQSTSNAMNNAPKSTPYRASLSQAKKSGKLKNNTVVHGVKPHIEPDVSDVIPAVIPVPHAFHSVPINKSRPRSKKQPTSPPAGLLPEISGHKIAVSLTTQKYL